MERNRYKRMAGVHFLPGLIILVLGMNWVSAFGVEIPTGQPPVPENVEPPKGATSASRGFLDRSHDYLDRTINGVVRWFDGFFGDTAGSDTVMAKNRLKWSNDLRVEKGNSLGYRASLRANLRLPKLEKWARLLPEPMIVKETLPIPTDADGLDGVQAE